jgi:hypothetical protein
MAAWLNAPFIWERHESNGTHDNVATLSGDRSKNWSNAGQTFPWRDPERAGRMNHASAQQLVEEFR